MACGFDINIPFARVTVENTWLYIVPRATYTYVASMCLVEADSPLFGKIKIKRIRQSKDSLPKGRRAQV